jgi:hypothetical protein
MPGVSALSLPLLIWCGLAAAIASEWIAGLGATLLRRGERSRSAPRLMSRPRGSTLVSLLTGTLLFAPLYGWIFEWAGRADLAAGTALGAAHGLVVTAWSIWASQRAEPRVRPALRAVLAHRARRTAVRVLYGAILGLLYVVPAA